MRAEGVEAGRTQEEEEEEQREDEEISESREGHISLSSSNPRHSNHQALQREAQNLREESSNLVVANEFGGYFVNAETRPLALLVSLMSLAAAVIVIASLVYRAVVLDPDCVIGPNGTLVDPDCETGGLLTEVSVALTIIISMVIPGFGFYGSWTKQEMLLQVFRFLSFIFGSYALVNLIRAVADPEGVAATLTACDVGEPCLETYFLLEGLYSLTYVFLNVAASSLLILKIRSVEERSATAGVEAQHAHVLRTATLVAVFNPNSIEEENHVHPAARAVPLVKPGTRKSKPSRLSNSNKSIRKSRKG